METKKPKAVAKLNAFGVEHAGMIKPDLVSRTHG